MYNSNYFDKNSMKLSKDNRILLLTHNDLDGSGPVIILKSIFKNVTVKHCTNRTMSYDIRNAVTDPATWQNYDKIIVTDISCTKYDAQTINADPHSKNLMILDHHETAEHLNKYNWAAVVNIATKDSIINENTAPADIDLHASGTSLLYDFLEYTNVLKNIDEGKRNSLKKLSQEIACYDTWDWYTAFDKKELPKDLNTLFWIYGDEAFEETFIKKINTNSDMIDKTDRLLLSIEERKINRHIEIMKNCFKTGTMELNGKIYSIMLCNCNNYLPETFEAMKQTDPDIDIYMMNTGTSISFRTQKDNISIGKLLEPLGGGGHPGAGGIKIEYDNIIELMSKTLQTDITLDEEPKTTTPLPRKTQEPRKIPTMPTQMRTQKDKQYENE